METIFAISTLALFGIAWVLGWWRMREPTSVLEGSTDANNHLLSGPVLAKAIIVSVLLGLVTESLFLITHVQKTLAENWVPSGWFIWGVLGSWVMVAILVLQLNHRRMHVFGLFVLPVASALFVIGYFSNASEAAVVAESQPFWRWLHAGSLLLGTVSVVFAFTSGALYMIQSNRLKHKKPSLGFRLPSLEKLQDYGERGLLASSLALALGLVSGIIMNLMSQTGTPMVNWSHPVVWTSSILLLWLVAATFFNVFYQPARYGRKVAYLTIASGLFLALELIIVLWSGHGVADSLGTQPGTPVETMQSEFIHFPSLSPSIAQASSLGVAPTPDTFGALTCGQRMAASRAVV